MFGQSKYIRNSISITFDRYQSIRRKVIEFEDFLKSKFGDHYGQPQVIPVPDELDPQIPRMIFGSKRGFSQIIISQIGMTLNVTYSPDWQTDIEKGKYYLKERSVALLSLFKMIKDRQACFTGLTTHVQLPMTGDDTIILEHMKKCFGLQINKNNFYDILIKKTNILNQQFFSNITVNNYRTWKINQPIQAILRFPNQKVVERGLEIIGDFNDRYAFNEKNDYLSPDDIIPQIIDDGLSQLANTINNIMGE